MPNYYPRRMFGGLMGEISEDCIPEGSLVSWVGNWNMPMWAKPASGGAPPLAFVFDPSSIRDDLRNYGFELITVDWISGSANPFVRVPLKTTTLFAPKQVAADTVTSLFDLYVDAKMQSFKIDVRPTPCPAPEPEPKSWNCPPGYEFRDWQTRPDGTRERGCYPIKGKAKGSSFVSENGGWDSDPFTFQYAPYQTPYQPTAPVPIYAQTQTPQTQTQTPSDGGKTEIPVWLWLLIGIGVLVIAEN